MFIKFFVLNCGYWKQKCFDSEYYQFVFLDILKIKDLPVGAKIQDVNTKYNDATIVWIKMESDHKGDPANSTALIADKAITNKCFDAIEPSNTDTERKQYGNNRWLYSNIRQWLNSDAAAGKWYTAQHSADAPPTKANIYDANTAYDQENGFLKNFSSQMKSKLLTVTKRVAKIQIDGGGYEDTAQKVFLLSNKEVGLESPFSVDEGSIYNLFNTSSNRIAYSTYNQDNIVFWWLRTPSTNSNSSVCSVDKTGLIALKGSAYGSNGIRPACAISSDTIVLKTPINGIYQISWDYTN